MNATLSIILELREKYQRSKWGMSVEEQKPISEEVFSKAKELGIPDNLIYADTEEMFQLFASKLK